MGEEKSELTVTSLVREYHGGAIGKEAFLERLRGRIHTAHVAGHQKAIALVERLPEPDRTREICQLFRESRWRETQMAAIVALSSNPTYRGLEFLFSVALNTDDLGLAQAAISSLGNTKNPLSARFLESYYDVIPAVLKPYLVHAIGQLSSRVLADDLLRMLPKAIEEEQVLLTQSLLLTLAELRVTDCISQIVQLLGNPSTPRALQLSAVLALGKLGRDPNVLSPFAGAFNENFVDWQLFSNSQEEILRRSQWTIDDYLAKLFESGSDFDASIPFELNVFSSDELRQGLERYRGQEYFERMCRVLACVHNSEIAIWYEELLDLQAQPLELWPLLLDGIGTHRDGGFEPLLKKARARIDEGTELDLYEKWCRACCLALPNGDQVLLRELERQGEDAAHVTVLNYLVDHVLASPSEPAKRRRVVQALEHFLPSGEGDTRAGARLIRCFAQLKYATQRFRGWMAQHIIDPNYVGSCLYFLEQMPDPAALPLIEQAANDSKIRGQSAGMILRAVSELEVDPLPDGIQKLLDECIQCAHGQNGTSAALQYLSRRPDKEAYDDITKLLHQHPRLQSAAVVALGALEDPRSTPFLVECLEAKSDVISGRALDALTRQPDDAAKYALLDILERQADDLEVCDKIIRCLEPPQEEGQRFSDRLEIFIRCHPDHPMAEGFVALRDRSLEPGEFAEDPHIAAGDLEVLDKELRSRIGMFDQLAKGVKASLRCAELPYLYPGMYQGAVDKSATILEYCKGVDILLEERLGRELLLPALREDEASFHNVIYAAGLNENYPNPQAVFDHLGLKGYMAVERLPISKMVRLCRSILRGRLLSESARVLDGLRAWAIVLILFGKSSGPEKRSPLGIRGVTDHQVFTLACVLSDLQELRNPVAHRATILQFADIQSIRDEVMRAFALLSTIFPNRENGGPSFPPEPSSSAAENIAT